MKKVYVRPTIEIENFEANEYVAACWQAKCAGEHISIRPIKADSLSGAYSQLGAADSSIHPAHGTNVCAKDGNESSGSYYHHYNIRYAGNSGNVKSYSTCKVEVTRYQPAAHPNVSN